MVPAVSSPWLRAPADLPADIRPMTRWGLIVGVLLTHVIVAAVVVMTSRQEAVVADASPISVSLLTETKSGELLPTAPAVVRPATPMPAPVAKAVPAPATPLPTPPVVAVAAPVQAQDMVVPVAPPVQTDSKTPPSTSATPTLSSESAKDLDARPTSSVAEAPRVEPVVATKADYLVKPDPKRSRLSEQLGEWGTTTLLALIGEDGTVIQVSVKTSSGYTRLDDEAKRATKLARFVPYQVNGVPRKREYLIPIRFDPIQ